MLLLLTLLFLLPLLFLLLVRLLLLLLTPDAFLCRRPFGRFPFFFLFLTFGDCVCETEVNI